MNRRCPLLDNITDTWGLEDKAARRTSIYSLTKLTSLQEITISCVMAFTAINISYNRMQAQYGTTSFRKYFVKCKCNLLYAEMQ
jgi:hypothetical protein